MRRCGRPDAVIPAITRTSWMPATGETMLDPHTNMKDRHVLDPSAVVAVRPAGLQLTMGRPATPATPTPTAFLPEMQTLARRSAGRQRALNKLALRTWPPLPIARDTPTPRAPEYFRCHDASCYLRKPSAMHRVAGHDEVQLGPTRDRADRSQGHRHVGAAGGSGGRPAGEFAAMYHRSPRPEHCPDQRDQVPAVTTAASGNALVHIRPIGR